MFAEHLSSHHRMQSRRYIANRKQVRERMLRKMANFRAAKERKRLANPVEREPKLVRFYPLEFCVRNKLTGEVSSWHDLRSARRIAKQAALLLRYCAKG